MSNAASKGRSLSTGVFLLALALNLSAAVIRVPTDQPNIQAAINVATNGDVVLVAAGTYFENIDYLGKELTVTSESGPSVTVIDGGSSNAVVTITSTVSRVAMLKGFTICNGYISANNDGIRAGGGVRIAFSSPTIVGNVITNNRVTSIGPGMSVSFGSPLVQSNVVVDNRAEFPTWRRCRRHFP